MIHNVIQNAFPAAGIMRIIYVLYRVFIRYCFFKILKYSGLLPFLCFSSVSVCTHARQVEHQRCSRTGRVKKNHKILRNTLFIEYPVSICVYIHMYRVFIKYCLFFQEFSKVCHLSLVSTRLLLAVQKITSQ